MHMRTLSKPMQCGLEMELPGSGWRSLHFKSDMTTRMTSCHYTVHLSFRLHSHQVERVGSRFIVLFFSLHVFILFIFVCS